MSRHIGTIEGCDIVEQDDKSATFTAAARLDGDGANGQFGQPPCYAQRASQARHWMSWQTPAGPATFSAW
jgi:hypothetical protein